MRILGLLAAFVCSLAGFALMGELTWPRLQDTIQLVGGFALVVVSLRLFERFFPGDDED